VHTGGDDEKTQHASKADERRGPWRDPRCSVGIGPDYDHDYDHDYNPDRSDHRTEAADFRDSADD